MAIEWVELLRHGLDEELEHYPRVATLATVAIATDGLRAEARCVVVREITATGNMLIASDARSAKNDQLHANPSATVVFWLPKRRQQFRISGLIDNLPADDAARLRHWRAMSDNARSFFFWPAPGSPRDPDQPLPDNVDFRTPPPETFEALILTPLSVDTLDLRQHPHLRRQWKLEAGEWMATTVNP